MSTASAAYKSKRWQKGEATVKAGKIISSNDTRKTLTPEHYTRTLPPTEHTRTTLVPRYAKDANGKLNA